MFFWTNGTIHEVTRTKHEPNYFLLTLAVKGTRYHLILEIVLGTEQELVQVRKRAGGNPPTDPRPCGRMSSPHATDVVRQGGGLFLTRKMPTKRAIALPRMDKKRDWFINDARHGHPLPRTVLNRVFIKGP